MRTVAVGGHLYSRGVYYVNPTVVFHRDSTGDTHKASLLLMGLSAFTSNLSQAAQFDISAKAMFFLSQKSSRRLTL